MKNADMPSMPVECEIIDNSGNYTGLTKREHFAAMAMQSCWYDLTDGNQPQHYAYAASSCVAMADALLKELEKQS